MRYLNDVQLSVLGARGRKRPGFTCEIELVPYRRRVSMPLRTRLHLVRGHGEVGS